MLRTLAARRPARRRGAVLIVVLAMLTLFAILGLSFVLYSEAQASAAKSNKLGVNEEAPPNPVLAAEGWMAALVYDDTDTGDGLMNPVRGHSLARSKYGFQAGVAGVIPFAGLPIPAEPGGFTFNGITDSRQIVRFTWDTTTASVFDPERYYNGTALRNDPNSPVLPGSYASKAYAFTYPDRHDFYLAYQDPLTGEVVVPSFHRSDLFGPLNPPGSASPNPNWTNAQGKFLTLRPRPLEHPNFPPVPMNPDGSYTGDVANLKFINGSQKNDSLWMYAGGPVREWNGRRYAACVAPLILDLSNRVNLSIAGNLANLPNNAAQPVGGHHGLGPWEIDPTQLPNLTVADLERLVQRRYGKTGTDYTPPLDPFTSVAGTQRVNRARVPNQGALLDFDGVGPPAPNDGSYALPQGSSLSSFPTHNNPLVMAAPYRYSPDQALVNAALTNHPSQLNPLLYARTPNEAAVAPVVGAGGFGHHDLIRLYARYSDSKNRQGEASFGTPALAPVTSLEPTPDTAAARTLRGLTTTYSVSQQWASVVVNTGTNPLRLGPVDLNRHLPDYRRNPAFPLSPVNVWPVGSTEYNLAHAARFTLARDIFVRLCGKYGFIDGTTAVYDPASGNVLINNPDPTTNPNIPAMRVIAQVAANIVDYIDEDDMVTPFVWNPTAASLTNSPNDPSLDGTNFASATDVASRVAYGTEQSRLVINEVYSGLFNDRNDESAAPPASAALKRRYWVELHNPTPLEPTNSAARSDFGAARLRYDPINTPLIDPANPTGPMIAPPADFNPYQLEVAEASAATPYSTVLSDANSPPGLVAVDTADTTIFPGMVVKARINAFVHDANPPSGPAPLAGTPDELNVVRPINLLTPPPVNGGNNGFYLIGPRDPHPAGGLTNTLSLPDGPMGIPPLGGPPPQPVNALSFDVTGGAPSQMDITTEAAKPSVVILRRLVDPYRPAQPDPTQPGFNPYITVDFVENVPTRDMATRTNTPMMRMAPDTAEPSVGRIHPYAAAPVYQDPLPGAPPLPAVRDQVNAAVTTAPHTFFNVNNPADNNRVNGASAFGFEWLVHLDRELVSLPELLHVSTVSPALLTHRFYNGTGYQQHALGSTTTGLLVASDSLGLLETGSRLPGVPLGGRQPGKININTLGSAAVLQAVFGRTEGNSYPVSNPNQLATIWDHLSPATPPTNPVIARTANRTASGSPFPQATVFEGGQDHPFVYGGASRTPNGSLDTDTPLGRYPTTTPSGTPVFDNPLAFAGHPHLVTEPLRKAWNNITPVSDSFLVVMTVGFFEVENPGPYGPANPPVLGRELFDTVRGDMRTQFAGVIDRSQLFTQIADVDAATGVALNTVQTLPNDPLTNPVPRAVQTKLVADAFAGATSFLNIEAVPPGGLLPDGTVVAVNTCAILGDGVVYRVTANSLIRVGYGDGPSNTGDGEWLLVTAVAQRQQLDANGNNQNVPGEVTLAVSPTGGATTTRFHGSGSIVSNVLFGNPGPQPRATLEQLQRRGVVPYFTRIEP